MPIVLAIEPDRRQAAHLTAIFRHQTGAELLLADTTEGALDAIGNRVPDLVLVPALLSPQDDAALAAALRVIAAAAHVRTLTIPVMGSGAKREAPGGMLAKWRKSRAASPEPDGCDPAVFGEQIFAYLQEGAAERADLEAENPRQRAAPVAEPVAAAPVARPPMTIEPPAPIAHPLTDAIAPWAAEPAQPWAADLIDQPQGELPGDQPRVELSEDQPRVELPEDQPRVELSEEHPMLDLSEDQPLIDLSEEQPLLDLSEEQPLIDVSEEQPLIDLSEEVAGLSDESGDELFDSEPVGIYTISAEADEPELDAFDLLPAILEPAAIADRGVTRVEAIAEAETDAPLVEPPEPPRPDIEPWVPMYLIPGRLWPALEGMPAETPAPRTEQPDWIELVASLRQDLERRRTDPPSAAAGPIAARPSDGGEADAHHHPKKQKPHAKKAKPVQDEWGFFDPEQCGFSTLLAKLDEFTEEGIGS